MIKWAKIIDIEREYVKTVPIIPPPERTNKTTTDVYKYRIVVETEKPINKTRIFKSDWEECRGEVLRDTNTQYLSLEYQVQKTGITKMPVYYKLFGKEEPQIAMDYLTQSMNQIHEEYKKLRAERDMKNQIFKQDKYYEKVKHAFSLWHEEFKNRYSIDRFGDELCLLLAGNPVKSFKKFSSSATDKPYWCVSNLQIIKEKDGAWHFNKISKTTLEELYPEILYKELEKGFQSTIHKIVYEKQCDVADALEFFNKTDQTVHDYDKEEDEK